ncbi:hypothetical protein OEZ60_14545 [Defluviimonas sp. WL0024]|uniref:DUF1127 domain-containing protein n=2 Tax=Albidovulum TaxID=205889 RepID=A0ABT3J4Q0_9RHOB|nr:MULTISPECIES: hypothetical protein [Defluviimonas]MCU9849220.1 hypothetical protein [Defluviimonas sp. WL0024]MCW3782653.1 hypothetical protein [Defluviimonas salinarum]
MLHRIVRYRLSTVLPPRPIGRVLADWRDRRAARARIRALLRRGDDHLIDDMGLTRDDLRARFGCWDAL